MGNPTDAAEDRRSSLPTISIRRKRIAIPIAVTVLIGSLALVSWLGYELIPGFSEWLTGLGDLAPWILVITFAGSTVLMGPATVFNIAAGALFGLLWGTLYSFLGAFVGSLACFLIARTGARSWIEGKLRKLPRFEKFDESVGEDGLKLVLLLRVSPVLPLAPVSYALGLSRIRFRDFLLSMPAMIPSMLPFIYAGDVAGAIVAVIRGDADKPWWEWVVLFGGFIATFIAAWMLTQKAKNAIESRSG